MELSFKKIVTATLVSTAMCFCANAQLSLPTKMINSNEYYYYRVKSNDTLDGLSRRLKIASTDIVKYNPQAKSGVEANQVLLFPVNAFKNYKPHTDAAATPATAATASVPAATITPATKKAAEPKVEKKAETTDKKTAEKKTNDKKANDSTEYYEIQNGDTMYGVARKFNSNVTELASLNPGLSADKFKTGDVIRIKRHAAKAKSEKKQRFLKHTIAENETFYSISRKYNVTVDEIKKANPSVDMNSIKIGTVLNVPIDSSKIVNAKK